MIFAIAFLILRFSSYGWIPNSRFDFEKNLDKTTVETLKKDVKFLSQEIGDRNADTRYEQLIKAEGYISKRFSELGYELSYQGYQVWGKTVKNIIAQRKASIKNKDVFIVGAHYDSCYNPGANDNASAVAVLLNIAEKLAKVELDQTIRFVAFVNEEPPYFKTENMGSLIYAKSLKAKNEKIKGMIALDSVGNYSNDFFSQRYPNLLGLVYPNRGNFIAIVSNLKSAQLNKQISKGIRSSKQIPTKKLIAPESVSGVSFSDHWSFWQMGYPAVMITDTAFLRGKNYHQQSDSCQTLNYPAMAKLTTALVQTLTSLVQSN